MFAQGKSRSYESLMREMPCNNKNSGNSKYVSPQFKYRYKDFACDYCLHHKACDFMICPYLVDSFDELLTDKSFVSVLENAEACKSKHKRTLVHLKAERGQSKVKRRVKQ